MTSSLGVPKPQSDSAHQVRSQPGVGRENSLMQEIHRLHLKNLELAASLELTQRKLALYRDYEADVEASLASIINSVFDRDGEPPCPTASSIDRGVSNGDRLEPIEAALARERSRIAQEIHDGLSQQLTGIVLELEACHRLVRTDPPQAEARLLKAIRVARTALADVRNYMFSLRTPSPSQMGLIPSLERLTSDFEQRNAIPTRLRVFGTIKELTPRAEEALLRVAQEALTNIGKHAQAKKVELSLRFGPSALELSVIDDGSGFDAETVLNRTRRGAGLGIPGMQERLKEMGGHLVVESSPGSGTRLIAVLPLNYRTAAYEQSE